jgi:hypothetical protein
LLTPLHFELIGAVFLLNDGKFCLDGISAVGNRADLCGRTKDRDGTRRDLEPKKLVASSCLRRMGQSSNPALNMMLRLGLSISSPVCKVFGGRSFVVPCLYCDRLCGLVVRVLGYRSGGPRSIPGTTKKKVSGSGTGSTQPR